MPQAGVAIGMALVAAERFPALADEVIALAISTTIVFEIIGPLATQLALSQAFENERRRELPRNASSTFSETSKK